MSAEINLPTELPFLARLPVHFKIDAGAKFSAREAGIIRSAARSFDRFAEPLGLGLGRVFVEDALAPLLTITTNPFPRDPESWGYFVHPEPVNWPCAWATIELYPRWLDSLWWTRKENLVRHELAHLLGFSHTDTWYSVMHPKLCTGWWPWGLSLLSDEKNELIRYWRPIVAAAAQPR